MYKPVRHMELDGISAIRNRPINSIDPAFNKKQSLVSARSLLHDGTLKLRPTESRVVSSQAMSIAAEQTPATASHRMMRSATQMNLNEVDRDFSSQERDSHTTKTVARQIINIRKVDSSERTNSMNKRKKIFPQSAPFVFKIPSSNQYYSVRQQMNDSSNALNLSFDENTKNSNFNDSHGQTRLGQTLTKTITPKSQLNLRSGAVQTTISKDSTKGFIMWISFMAAVALIIFLRVFMFV